MTNEERVTITATTVLISVVVLIIGLSVGWPVWVWLPLAVLPIPAGELLRRGIARRREQRRLRSAYWGRTEPAPPQPAPREERLSGLSVPSAAADYRFLLSGTVYWVPRGSGPAHGNPGALARNAIVTRAACLLADAHPMDHAMLTERVNAELGTPISISDGQLQTWAVGMAVTLPETDGHRLHRLEEVRKKKEVWEHERHHERDLREYLGEDVLSDPGHAVVWWLARNSEHTDSGLQSTVDNIGNLRMLTSAAHAVEIPEWTEDRAPDTTPTNQLLAFVTDALTDSEDGEQDFFAARMVRLLDTHGHHEAAAALRKRFQLDAHESGEPDEEPDDGSGNGEPAEQPGDRSGDGESG